MFPSETPLLEEIGSKTFFRFTRLTRVIFLGTVRAVSPVRLVIGDSAFESCYRLDTLCLPPTVHTLGAQALANCRILTSVHLPEQLRVLGPRVMKGCVNLESIRIPPHIAKIPYGAFENCRKLGIVEFASSGTLKSIEPQAFSGCKKLPNVSLPASVSVVKRHAFYRCTKLVSVELSETTAFNPSAFSQCLYLVNLKLTTARAALPLSNDIYCLEEVRATTQSDGLLMDCERMQQVYVDGDWNGGDSIIERNKTMSDILVQKLIHRWDDLPIHRLCYYQAHHPPEETARAMQEAQRLIRCQRSHQQQFQPFDEFGLSPFHVLAMSTHPKYPICAQLMRLYSVHVLFAKNPWGMRPATCAFRNPHMDYTTAVQQYIRAIVSVRVPQLKSKNWRMYIYQLLEVISPEEFSIRSLHLVRLQLRLTRSEQIESLAILEHAVWKAKLLEAKDDEFCCKESPTVDDNLSPLAKRKRIEPDSRRNAEDRREACRTFCGSNVIIFRVLPFLEN
ncbi:unnamed protein product [Cylindrotheca closterium]|nr:unnamed protein product [Cylindrotheca closterium]